MTDQLTPAPDALLADLARLAAEVEWEEPLRAGIVLEQAAAEIVRLRAEVAGLRADLKLARADAQVIAQLNRRGPTIAPF